MDGTDCGFIFDWDGVVIDSHAAHEGSWQMLFAELGRPMPEGFFKKTFGMRNQQIIPAWFDFVQADDHAESARLGERKEELYREILQRDGIAPLPGLVKTRLAAVTTSPPSTSVRSVSRFLANSRYAVFALGGSRTGT